jgi:hypothetical protein
MNPGFVRAVPPSRRSSHRDRSAGRPGTAPTGSNTSVWPAFWQKLRDAFLTRTARDRLGTNNSSRTAAPTRSQQGPELERESGGMQYTTHTENLVNGGATNKNGGDKNPSKGEDGPAQIEGNNNNAALKLQLQQCFEEINNMAKIVEDRRLELEGARRKLEGVEQETTQQIQSLQEQLLAKDKMIERLRAKATEAASKATEMSVSSSLLRLPECEILKAWQSLHFEVRNFGMNYMKNASDRTMRDWADQHDLRLREITPHHKQFALDRKCSVWLIQAAIWTTLTKFLFGDSATHGSICWAGKYSGKVSRLSESSAIETCSFLMIVGSMLYQAVGPADSEKHKVFHQWKAMTTSLLSTLGPHNGREDKTAEMVEELEELLDPWRSKSHWNAIRQSLQSLVRHAVTLDESFCGQHEWYFLWYPEPRFDCAINLNQMQVEEGSATSASKTVAFVIRPHLCRISGWRKNHHESIRLDQCAVWAHASHYSSYHQLLVNG